MPRDKFVASYSFRFGDVFSPDDYIARYVLKLSIALGDLRIAAHYATRGRQTFAERLYFVRLTASHLREIVLLLDPPNRAVVPSIDDFLRALPPVPRGTKPTKTEIRSSHRAALKEIDREMKGRDPITVDGRKRLPRLRDDLRHLRNGFFHYGVNHAGDAALRDAMRSTETKRTSYTIRTRRLRARYADLVGGNLAHPFDFEFVAPMHEQIVTSIGPISGFIHQVEAAWLFSRPPGVVTVVWPGGRREPLRRPRPTS